MSAKGKFKYDESKLRPGQRQVAVELVEREFTPHDKRKDLETIAQECGTTRTTIWRWTTGDPNFIAYKNYLASEVVDSHLPLVYAKLIEVIRDDKNTKGMELFLKRIGDLDSKSEITVNNNGGDEESFEDRKAALLERLKDEGGEDAE